MEEFKWEYGSEGNDNYNDAFKKVITLSGDYLSTAINDKYLDWSYITPVFLAASTGTGKTTLFEELIEKSAKAKRDLTILILSNRSAIDLAFKKRLLKRKKRKDILDLYTNVGLSKLYDFGGGLFIMTYQKLSKLIDDNNSDFHNFHFDLVICDEIGFIYDDSLLMNTGKIITYIVEHFSTSVRCYASATPEPVYKYIYNLENYYYKNRKYNCSFGSSCHSCSLTKLSGRIICYGKSCIDKCSYGIYDGIAFHDPEKDFNPMIYKMVKGYGYIRLHFVQSYDEIIKMIKDGKLKFKSVVFFDTKVNGENMEGDLPNSIYIDANTKYIRNVKDKRKETYDYIIENETFEQNVLLCSTAFDCGINLKYSSGIHNIVISTADPNQFKQMLGRIRVKEGDIVNLFIVDMGIKELKNRLEVVKRKLSAVHNFHKNKSEFLENYYNDSTSKFKYPLVQGIFYIKSDGIEFNEAAEMHLSYLKEILENIITEYESGDKQAYIKNVLKWLERENDYSEDKWVNYRSSDELRAEFIEFLQKMNGKKFVKKDDNYIKFRIEFQILFNKLVLGKNITITEEDKKHIWGDKIINRVLAEEGFNFMLEKIDDYIIFKSITCDISNDDQNNGNRLL